MRSFIVIVVIMSCLVLGTHVTDNGNGSWVVKDKISNSSIFGWKKTNSTPPEQDLEMTIVLSENQAIIKQVLKEMSDPTSINYGKKMSKDQVSELAMLPGTKQTVLNWLQTLPNQKHIHTKEKGTSRIAVIAPLSTWEEVLKTKFYTYNKFDEAGNDKVIRTEIYYLPKEVADSIATIHGTTNFPMHPHHIAPVATGTATDMKTRLSDSIRINPGLTNLAAGGTRTDINAKPSSDTEKETKEGK